MEDSLVFLYGEQLATRLLSIRSALIPEWLYFVECVVVTNGQHTSFYKLLLHD